MPGSGDIVLQAIFRAVDRFTRPIATMAAASSRLSRAVEGAMRRVNGVLDRVHSGIKRVAAAAAIATAATVGVMGSIATTGAEYEQTLTNAAAKFPGEIRRGTAAFKALDDAAQKVGATTEFTASQSAQALNFLAMAGFDAEQSIAALPGVVDLATAAQIELGQASDVATDSLGAFNLLTKDSVQLGQNLARVNDVIAMTTKRANTDVSAMFEAIASGAPIATSAGAEIEEFSAMVGVLANAGIKGSEAGNALKNIFLRLEAPAAAGAASLRELGVAAEVDGNLRPVIDVLGDLNKAMQGLGKADQAKHLDAIFGKRAIGGATVLLQAGSEQLWEFTKTLQGAGGESKKMAGTMRDTLLGDMKTFESTVESVKLAIFGLSSGAMRDVTKKATAWVAANRELIATKLNEWIQKLADNLPKIIDGAKKVLNAVIWFYMFRAAIWAVQTAAMIYNGVVFAAGVITKIWGIATNFSAIAGWALSASIWAMNTAAGIHNGLIATATFLAKAWAFATNFAAIKAGVLAAATWVGNAAMTAFNAIVAMNPLGILIIAITAAVAAIIWMATHWDTTTKYISKAWQWMRRLMLAVPGLNLLVVLGETIVSYWEPVADFFGRLWAKIKAVIELAKDPLASIGDALFGDGTDGKDGKDGSPQVITQGDRTSREISESIEKNQSELLIKDETGRAELKSKGGGLVMPKLDPSGGFE